MRTMRRLLSLGLLSGLLVANAALAQDVDAEGEASMLARINALRAEQELAPLARDAELDAVARAHSAEMAQTGALAHVSATTGTPQDRVQNAGIPATTIAENVAMHRTTDAAHDALLASASHRANLLEPSLTHVGIAAVRTAQGVYVTQLLAQLPSAAPEAPAPVEAPAPAEAPSDLFGIIPPFVESLASSVTAPIRGDSEAAPSILADEPEAAPQIIGAEPDLEADAAPAVAAPSTAATAPTAPSTAPAPATAAAPTLAPSTTTTLRQLMGLAASLLGGS